MSICQETKIQCDNCSRSVTVDIPPGPELIERLKISGWVCCGKNLFHNTDCLANYLVGSTIGKSADFIDLLNIVKQRLRTSEDELKSRPSADDIAEFIATFHKLSAFEVNMFVIRKIGAFNRDDGSLPIPGVVSVLHWLESIIQEKG